MAHDEALARAVAAALQAAGLNAVERSPRRRSEYAADASLYRVAPLLVAFPRSADDLAAAVEVCRGFGVPLTARGGGTSVAGNAVGAGVVLDTSRHLNRILAVEPAQGRARVQPGVVLDDLQRDLAGSGLRFGPDPSTHARCTIGGMIGNNACGARALGYGRTVDSVDRLEVITGRGERLTLAAGAWPATPGSLRALSAVLDGAGDGLAGEFGRFPRQVSGYALEYLLSPPPHGDRLAASAGRCTPDRPRPDLARALVGSEGTLALVASAEVLLTPLPAASVLVVLGYPSFAAAAEAVPAALAAGPVAVEGIDGRIVEAVRARGGNGAVADLPRAGGWLLIEVAASDPAAARHNATRLVADAAADTAEVLPEGPRRAAVWGIREAGAGIVSRTVGAHPAYAGWEDAAVPPDALAPYLRDFDALVRSYAMTALPYGHLGDGCVHVRLDFPFSRPDGVAVFEAFLADAADLVVGYGGSLSGEHGDGRARSALLERMYSPGARRLFADVKAAFDPDGVLNPGVIVDPAPVTAGLRPPGRRPVTDRLGLAHRADGGDLSAAAHRCVGLAVCRQGPTDGQVMCPSYQATGDEKDTTRGRARVLQDVLAAGDRGGVDWADPGLAEALELCLACKGCARDCPTGVDMATYKTEVLAQRYRRRLRPRLHYSLGWLPRWLRLAGVAPRSVNRLLAAPQAAGLLARFAGVSDDRPLPGLATSGALRSLPRGVPLTRRADGGVGPASPADAPARPRAVVLLDTFTERFAPEAGAATVGLLADAGYAVVASAAGQCCGLTWLTTGQLSGARRRLRRLLAHLDGLRGPDGIVVGVEPSCTAVLRADAGELLPDTHRDVAAATFTLAEALTRADWQPPDLTGQRILAQPHCHHRAVLGWEADADLLTRAGAEVAAVAGCCGLAGTFGYEPGHVTLSRTIADLALVPALERAAPGTAVLADGFSCRTQIEQCSSRSGAHLAAFLEASGVRTGRS